MSATAPGANLQAHDDLQARIWNDDRGLPPGTREVALAMAWILHRERADGESFPWRRLRELLGCEGLASPKWRVDDLIAGDAPRYDPGWWLGERSACEGPRLRPYKRRRGTAPEDRCNVSLHHPHLGDCRYPLIYGGGVEPPERDDRVCGATGVIKVKEADMVTGWVTGHWFCRRHEGRAAEVKAQVAARGEPPEPIPNTGGLLPRYFAADWAALYLEATKRGRSARRGWKPPYYGCDADDWPVPGKTVIPKRPRLALVATA